MKRIDIRKCVLLKFVTIYEGRAPIIMTLIDQSALFRISEQSVGPIIACLTKFNKFSP